MAWSLHKSKFQWKWSHWQWCSCAVCEFHASLLKRQMGCGHRWSGGRGIFANVEEFCFWSLLFGQNKDYFQTLTNTCPFSWSCPVFWIREWNAGGGQFVFIFRTLCMLHWPVIVTSWTKVISSQYKSWFLIGILNRRFHPILVTSFAPRPLSVLALECCCHLVACSNSLLGPWTSLRQK